MNRKVFIPKKAKCKKCGSPLAFYLNENKNLVPCNIDGSDHWDDCSYNRQHGVYGIKIEIITERFIGFTPAKHNRPLYSGEAPPWEI